MAQEMRVAISNEDVKCTLEILRIQDPGGKRIVRREYALTAGEAHGLHLARVRLTNDGKYLVAHDGTQLCVFELSNTQAKLVCSLADKIATSIAGVVLHLFDVSLNGHVAAYGAEHRIRVIRIPDGQIALEIEQEPDSLALSPDGRLLALVSRKRKSILLYHVPQAQK
jgi:6-phosphogluconolactonase (cycloisomerase 2 family)